MDRISVTREIHTVSAAAIGDEAEVLQLIHEVLKSRLDGVEQLRPDQTLDDPVRIPVV